MFCNIHLQLLVRSFRKIDKRFFCDMKENKPSLLGQLHAKIKFTGPITVHEYMKEVLTNPISGYYMKKNVFGKKGDFVTAPEVSQMFGELISIWIYSEWQKMGSPKPFQLIEFGPGTGSLMQDILRTLKQLKLGRSEFEVHLVEKSPFMSNLQESTLCQSSSHHIETAPSHLESTYKSSYTTDKIPVHWHYHFSDIPDGFSMIFAHEFFDALPIHKLTRTDDGWREMLIDINSEKTGTGEELRYVISRGPTPASKLFVGADEKRNHIEVSPEAGALIQQLNKRLKENGGATLIIDYGHDGTAEDTFKAFKNHHQVSPLLFPGDADLSSDVDFAFLRKYVDGTVIVYGPVPQGLFLTNMGIEFRLQKLGQQCSIAELRKLVASYKMLVEPQQMGHKFKVMALLPKVMEKILSDNPPAGFCSFE